MTKNIIKSVLWGGLSSLLLSACSKTTPTLNAPVPTPGFSYAMLTPGTANTQNLQLVNTSTNAMTANWRVTDEGGKTVGAYTGDTVKIAIVFAGTYTVKMAASGPGGVSDTISQTVTIAKDNPYAVGPTTALGVLTGAALGNTQRTWIPERVVNTVIVWDNYANCLKQINGGSGAWWAFGAGEITPGTGRDGYLDDKYTFTFAKAGQLLYDDNSTVYLDAGGSGWTKALPAPWNTTSGTVSSVNLYNLVPALKPWGSGTFSYAIAAAPAGAMQLGTITVNGTGAHLGLPDKAGSGDLTTPGVTSVTYDILKINAGLKDAGTGVTYDEMILGLQESGLVWTYMFRSNR